MILVINDLHLGVTRRSGTTPDSARALRDWMYRQFSSLLETPGADTIIINGDLTDSFNIPYTDILEIWATTAEWLARNPARQMIWSLGNHDLSKNSTQLGAVQFLGTLLRDYPNFTLVDKPTTVCEGRVHIIPHALNQIQFNQHLSDTPDGVSHALLHCNYDNGFAAESDHSLNLSREQARALKARGIRMVLGHEHQRITDLAGWVTVVGNQFPSSVSDCLSTPSGAQKDGCKHAFDLDGGFIRTWAAEGSFVRADWRELSAVPADAQFIRVEGEADGGESAKAIRAISALRQTHGAFIITNAVKVDGAQVLEAQMEAVRSVSDARGLDVLELLYSNLNPAQREVLQSLMEKEGT